jgi:putative transposase
VGFITTVQPAQVYDASMPSHLKRYQTEGHYHFLTFSCYRRFPYLGDERSRTVFLDMLETLRQRHRLFVFGYVLMPEHVHLLLSEPSLERLDNTLRALKGQTSKLLKGSRPQFWQSRYYDFNVFTQAKFVEKLRYIHRNPVTRGLVGKPEDFPWSSFRHWATGETGRVEIESHWTWMKREGADTPLIRKMRA